MQEIDLKEFGSKIEQDQEKEQKPVVDNDYTGSGGVFAVDDSPPVVGFDNTGKPIIGIRGKKEPCYTPQQENYRYRLFAYMKAEGMTNTEIAERTGVNVTTVNYVVKQPYMEQMILEEIHNRGGDKVSSFFKESALPAAELLAKIVQDEEASNKDKINAANAILDRVYGKPNQPITSFQGKRDLSTMSDDELASYLSGGRPKPVDPTTATSK